MRIVQLTTVHRWDDVRIFHKISRSLVRAGHDVHLVAPAADEIPDETAGVTMHWLPGARNRITRIFNSWRALRCVRRIRPDAVHFHDPELIPVMSLARLLGVRVVYDVHEDLPRDVRQKNWIPGVFRYPISWLTSLSEWIFSRVFASFVISVTETICSRFPRKKTRMVRNFPILDELDVPDGNESSVGLMVYIGGLSEDRGVLEIIDAVKVVSGLGLDIHLDLIGRPDSTSFSDTVSKASSGAPVRIWGHVDRLTVRDRLRCARASLVVLHPTPTYLESLPVKLFEAMSAGVPVIASDFPLWREIIHESECGRMVDPLDPQSIAEAMQWMIEHPEEADAMGKRGREAVESRYNWDRESDVLVGLYAEMAVERPND